jgi:hypothetical protein
MELETTANRINGIPVRSFAMDEGEPRPLPLAKIRLHNNSKEIGFGIGVEITDVEKPKVRHLEIVFPLNRPPFVRLTLLREPLVVAGSLNEQVLEIPLADVEITGLLQHKTLDTTKSEEHAL